jgi:hypothetical protein
MEDCIYLQLRRARCVIAVRMKPPLLSLHQHRRVLISIYTDIQSFSQSTSGFPSGSSTRLSLDSYAPFRLTLHLSVANDRALIRIPPCRPVPRSYATCASYCVSFDTTQISELAVSAPVNEFKGLCLHDSHTKLAGEAHASRALTRAAA